MNGVNGYDNFDGPTSAYVKRNRKTSFAYKFKKMLYERKKAEVEKSISFDDNHAIEEVCQYVQEQWGFKEADRNSAEYKFMYKQIKHDINSEINLFLYVREDNDAHMDIEILWCHAGRHNRENQKIQESCEYSDAGSLKGIQFF